MTMSPRELALKQVLALSDEDQAYVAQALEVRREASHVVDDDWLSSPEYLEMLQRRWEECRTDKTKVRDAREFFAELIAKSAARRRNEH